MDLTNAYDIIIGKLEVWLSTLIEMLPNLLLAILTLVAFYAIGIAIRKAVNKVLGKTTNNKTIIHLIESIVGTIVVGIGIFIALGILNLDGTVKSLLAGAGIIGLALGFAFQDIASNFISGMLLSIRHPFGIGDIIDTNGYFGSVIRINLRNTILKTPQGQIVYIPNKLVFESPFENYSSEGKRRIDLSCGVSYGDDLEKAKKIAVEAVESLNTYDKSRDVELFFNEFGDSSINFMLRFWIDFNSNKQFWEARNNAIMAIKKAFDENDIMIPFPIRTLDFGIKGGEKLNTMIKGQS